jgi:hypothetical protein
VGTSLVTFCSVAMPSAGLCLPAHFGDCPLIGHLLGHDAVGPFDQRNENGRIAKLGVPIREIGFRDPTGPGAIPSSKDRNVFGDDLLAQLAERRPTNGKHRV